MSVPRFMLSWVSQKYGALELRSFRAEFPNHCLIWEPGEWRPPSKTGATVVAGPSASTGSGPARGGDALAIILKPRADLGPLQLGRAPTSDVAIDDATISSTHLELVPKADAWAARNPGSTNGSWVNQKPIPQGLEVALAPGDLIKVGQVTLTYYDPKGLYFRLKAG